MGRELCFVMIRAVLDQPDAQHVGDISDACGQSENLVMLAEMQGIAESLLWEGKIRDAAHVNVPQSVVCLCVFLPGFL